MKTIFYLSYCIFYRLYKISCISLIKMVILQSSFQRRFQFSFQNIQSSRPLSRLKYWTISSRILMSATMISEPIGLSNRKYWWWFFNQMNHLISNTDEWINCYFRPKLPFQTLCYHFKLISNHFKPMVFEDCIFQNQKISRSSDKDNKLKPAQLTNVLRFVCGFRWPMDKFLLSKCANRLEFHH